MIHHAAQIRALSMCFAGVSAANPAGWPPSDLARKKITSITATEKTSAGNLGARVLMSI